MTFSYDIFTVAGDSFTIATDRQGRTYRVLLTVGQPRGYKLAAWRSDGSQPNYRARYINEGHALYPAVDAAEKARPRPQMKPGQRSRFEAEFA